jgi:DNA polymerase
MSTRTWQTVLKEIKYPERTVVIDFESYFSDTLGFGCQTTPAYVMDERFEFTGVGVWWLHRPKPYFVSGPEVKDFMRNIMASSKFVDGQQVVSDCTIIVQNHKFENTIFNKIFNMRPKYLIDVQDLAGHVEARAPRKLAHIAPKYGFEDKGTNLKELKGMRWDDIVEAGLLEAHKEYTLQDAKLEGELFMQLAPMVTQPEIEFEMMQITSEMYQRPTIRLSKPKAQKVLHRLKTTLDNHIPEGLTQDEVSSNTIFTTKLIELVGVDGVPTKFGKRPGKKMTALLGEEKVIPAISKDDEGMKQLLANPNPEVRALCEARLAVKSWPLHIKRVAAIIQLCKDWGGAMGIPLNYYGAHTGRWSGGEGINMQNLPRLLQDLREAIFPVDDLHKFIYADSCQIEARGVAWLAGQDDLLQAFANNEDPYSQFASDMFGAKVRKPRKTDPKPVYERMELRRGVGKVGVLGCGYGMGDNRCYEQMMEDDFLYSMMVKGLISPQTAADIVDLYRTKYAMVPRLWDKMEDAMKFVIKYPNEVANVNGKIKFYADPEHRSTIYMELPSGRRLRYQRCSLSKGSIRWKYGVLWGGSLVENAVQAFSRDIIAYHMSLLNKDHIPIVNNVHDSVTILWRKDQAERGMAHLLHTMRQRPDWCPDLPLDAEGCVCGYLK